MTRRSHLLSIGAVVAVAVAGCGGSSGPASTRASRTDASEVRGLLAYVVGHGGEPGYKLYGSITTEDSDLAWAELPGFNQSRTNAEAARVKADGFVLGISQELSGDGQPAQGVSQVASFTTPAGAAAAEADLVNQFGESYQRQQPTTTTTPTTSTATSTTTTTPTTTTPTTTTPTTTTPATTTPTTTTPTTTTPTPPHPRPRRRQPPHPRRPHRRPRTPRVR